MISVVTVCFLYFTAINGGPVLTTEKAELTFNNTRRILNGHNVGDTRPYMVYLRAGNTESDDLADPNWLCSGVIIHPRYILTSAACIENVKQFFVISGTHKWHGPKETNDCVTNGGKKAIWKCVPKNYVFDGNEYDNIQWMNNDIAVVKVEDNFNFEKRVRGCDFIPKMIAYNNKTDDETRTGTLASIAGWGAGDKFTSADFAPGNSARQSVATGPVSLKETDVMIISKKHCKKRWPERYHHIIQNSMICTKDSSSDMSSICTDNVVNCKELVYSDENEEDMKDTGHFDPTNLRRMMPDPEHLVLHGAHHHDTRRMKIDSGGFCENDHGGPLVVGQGKASEVVGVISACQTRALTHQCYGPFLYTSVYKNRHVIECAINKEIIQTCRKLLRSLNTDIERTYLSWELKRSKRVMRSGKNRNVTEPTTKITESPSEETTPASLTESPPVETSPGRNTETSKD